MEVTTESAEETKALGRKIADTLKGGEILALSGNLGTGKTTFVQGLAEGLGYASRVTSPTFILMRSYPLPITHHPSPITNLYHVDLYRFEENVENEAVNIGLTDIWQNPKNVVVIEWAEKIANLLPKNTQKIEFSNKGDNLRKITIN